ncbi:Carboxylesterase type B [Gemmatirosa kalamazoonensis]|uniref:Carboxylic ester hydrolase n=1 Tax=Gemmatirosa kalamazoonensis TaxID=861299 RepID=W0REP2_9BACT|nr:carboxylesterase family protein [Gemmatirosa kalamazoonensis]AHG87848.1 Carboxylesterase type B [Gemmatirosa kalamazoonensis]
MRTSHRRLAVALAPIAACLAIAARPLAAPAPRVTVDTGVLEGTVDSASDVLVFRGVPYAAPPVGAGRWRPPRRAARWTGVRKADRLGHNCMQGQPYADIDPYAAGVSEDCLYLNVWTTSLGGRRPVMVWIHGGGFFAGFGGEERHDGAPLARKGVVVVTLNYRLGPFGFMAHPALAAESPHHSAGNYGLLDQIAALQWVKRNIARFGGDPSRVTIFGESAGGMSVGSLVASPLAAGLFQRAIMESGTGVGVGISRLSEGEATGRQLADSLGIHGDGADALARLRAASAESVLAASGRLARPGTPVHWPVVDGWVLPHPVDSALSLGTANRVPVIVGSNRDEGDEWMGAPSRTFGRLASTRVPTWLYIYSRVGEDSASRARGAYHSSEITFVFGRPHPLQASAGRAAYDSTLAEAMSDYWVSFATSADPNGPPNGGRLPRWPRYDRATDALLELGPEIAPRTLWRKAVYDSLDAAARARGQLRP